MPYNEITPTPTERGSHQYVAQRVIAFCAAFVDVNHDITKMPMINSNTLIAEACKQFGITGSEFNETHEMREGYQDNMQRVR
jgi:hypothetical protein